MEKHKIVERKRREKTKELMTELQVTCGAHNVYLGPMMYVLGP